MWRTAPPPPKVSPARYRRDAFDAADHLRKQPFVDGARIGVIGLSMGAMGILGATAEGHSAPEGRQAFRAVVAIYPICYFPNVPSAFLGRRVDIRYVPASIAVPLQVQMGELDTEAPPKDCLPMLDVLRTKGAPVDYVVHKNATHSWDVAALGSGTHSKRGPRGNTIDYRYNAAVTAASIDRAFGFLDRHVKGGAAASN